MTPGTTTGSTRAAARARRSIDGHNDLLWAAREKVGYDFDRLELTDTDAAGRSARTPTCRGCGPGESAPSSGRCSCPPTLTGDEAVTATLEQVDGGHTMISRYADQLALATTVEDVERAWQQGRIASLMGAEGGHQINESLGTLRMLHRLGVRYLTLTHNDNVPWADSATDEPVLGGLSDFGREVVAEMNRIGMLVDLSHVSADVMRQALDVSTVPVVFSHSSARAVCDHPRNVPDDVLARLAGNGGVCMVTFVPQFVNQEVRDWDDASTLRGPSDALRGARHRATLDDVVAHVEHVREVAGVEHVGLGGDYDGTDWLPDGLEDVTGYPRLLAALAERGLVRRGPRPADLPQRAAGDGRRRADGGREAAPRHRVTRSPRRRGDTRPSGGELRRTRCGSAYRRKSRTTSTGWRSRPSGCTSWWPTATRCSSRRTPASARRSTTRSSSPRAPRSSTRPTTCGARPRWCSRSRSPSPRSTTGCARGRCCSPTCTWPPTGR